VELLRAFVTGGEGVGVEVVVEGIGPLFFLATNRVKMSNLLQTFLLGAALATTIAEASANTSGWQACSSIQVGEVTEGTAPRWAIQQKGTDFGIAGISNHGLCNQKLHKVVICNPLNDDNNPVCDAPVGDLGGVSDEPLSYDVVMGAGRLQFYFGPER
jgi:hypothetical protein